VIHRDKNPPGSKKEDKRTIASWRGRSVVGIVVLIVAVGSYSGVHVASDANGFCSSCHADHGQQWASSTHKAGDCVDCHVDPGVIGAAKAKVNGIRNVLVSLSQGNEVERGADPLPVNTKNCRGCHAGILRLSELGYADLPDNSLKVDGLVMGHRIHVEKHGIDCVWCHRGTVHRDPEIVGKYSFNMPLHADCVICHNGEHLEQFDVTLPHQEDKEHCTMCHPTYEEPGGEEGQDSSY